MFYKLIIIFCCAFSIVAFMNFVRNVWRLCAYSIQLRRSATNILSFAQRLAAFSLNVHTPRRRWKFNLWSTIELDARRRLCKWYRWVNAALGMEPYSHVEVKRHWCAMRAVVAFFSLMQCSIFINSVRHTIVRIHFRTVRPAPDPTPSV